MSDPVTNNYSLVLPTVGGDVNLWGGVLNNGVINALDAILSAVQSVSMTVVDVTLTTNQFASNAFTLSGVLTGNLNLIVPLGPNSATVACAGRFIINNQTTGAFIITVKTAASGSTGVVVPQGLRTELYSDGTNVQYTDDGKVYIVSISGSPNGQLAGTAASINNPPFPFAIDYVTKKLYYPTTTGNSTTTIWQQLLANSAPTPVALFTSLAIKVLTNTTTSVAATGVTLTDGAGNYAEASISATLNFGTTGANALDVNAIAAATWYSIWVIAKADGTVATLASTSQTLGGLTLPSGYIYAGRIGWNRTSVSVAQLLGTYQFGRQAQYVAGLAQSPNGPIQIGNTGGSSMSSLSVATVVPPTASKISVTVFNLSAATSVAAPNTSWPAAGSGNALQNIVYASNSGTSSNGWGEFVLESMNIAVSVNGGTGNYFCVGWEDNI